MKKFDFSNWLTISSFSIKKLTILGFTFVAMPLVLALLYSASQVTQLSHQSTLAIFNVAELIKVNRQLNFTLGQMERSASQFLILKDPELLITYQQQEAHILSTLDRNAQFKTDRDLLQLSNDLSKAIKELNSYLLSRSRGEQSLAQVKEHFKQLVMIRKKIADRSNNQLALQAEQIEISANAVRRYMLKSLLIIPFTLVIAAIFIFLITKPLKRLLSKIHQLEQGNFENKVAFRGSPEIKEIADALEVMRNRLHALELQKSSFIRHISHELKTPLAAIREGTELLYDHSVGELNVEQQEISNIIRTSVTRLQRLIEDLLDFNIVLDSTSLQDEEMVELSTVLEHVMQQRTLDIKRRNLTVNYEAPTITLKVNSKQLSVILDNLLSNAIKYSEESTNINLTCSLENSYLILTISDHGPGIESSQQAKIFNAFYQGTPAKNTQIKGSGLGLTIVKELLMRLNGAIKMQSRTGENSGTSMTITLPNAYHQEKIQRADN
jgi:two-component system sensor histidine kinase GlrK